MFALIALLAGLAAPSEPAAKPGTLMRCEIKSADGRYSGPCRFQREKGGSFNVTPASGRGFFTPAKGSPHITMIDVGIQGSEAGVSGLTSDGVSSRWGMAKRSTKDRACWAGEDFSVCVYEDARK